MTSPKQLLSVTLCTALVLASTMGFADQANESTNMLTLSEVFRVRRDIQQK